MKDMPYFPWYPIDAMTDEAYNIMKDEELGFYHRCLNHAWVNEGLPGDLDALAATMHRTREEIDRLWVVVGRKWIMKNGRFRNPRQEKERDLATAKHAERSASGRKGNAKRWGSESLSDSSAIARAFDSDSIHKKQKETINGENQEMRLAPVESISVVMGTGGASKDVSVKPMPVSASRNGNVDWHENGVADWFERRLQEHPNKKDIILAKQYIVGIPQVIIESWRDEFERVHRMWCESEKWRWKQGAAVPSMAAWILDQGWRYPPVVEAAPPTAPQQRSTVDPEIKRRLALKAAGKLGSNE